MIVWFNGIVQQVAIKKSSFILIVWEEFEYGVDQNGCMVCLFFFSFAWKNNFHLGFFAVEGDSQIWCMNVMFSANKIDLISLSCLNLWLLRLLLAVIRILIRLNAERKNLSAVVIGHIQGKWSSHCSRFLIIVWMFVTDWVRSSGFLLWNCEKAIAITQQEIPFSLKWLWIYHQNCTGIRYPKKNNSNNKSALRLFGRVFYLSTIAFRSLVKVINSDYTETTWSACPRAENIFVVQIPFLQKLTSSIFKRLS